MKGGDFAVQHTRLAYASTFLFLLGFTKFRSRDVSDTIATRLDAQIFFELACYAGVMLIALFLLLRLKRLGSPRVVGWIELFIFAYVLFVLTSLFWSLNPPITAIRAFQLAVSALIAWLFCQLMSLEAYLGVIARAIFLYCCGFAALALAFPWADGTQVGYFGEVRFSWFSVHPGLAGSTAALGILLLGFEWLGRLRKRSRGPLMVLLPLMCVPLALILISTQSRGSLFASILALSVALLLYPKSLKLRVYALAALTCAALIISTDLASYVTRISNYGEQPLVAFLLRGQSTDLFLSFTGRTFLWEDVVELISAQPLSGSGFGAARMLLLDRYFWAADAHNAYLDLALSLGLFGAFLLLFPLLSVFLCAGFWGLMGSGEARLRPALVAALLAYFLLYAVVSESFALAGYGLDPFLVFVGLFGYARHRHLLRGEWAGGTVSLGASP